MHHLVAMIAKPLKNKAIAYRHDAGIDAGRPSLPPAWGIGAAQIEGPGVVASGGGGGKIGRPETVPRLPLWRILFFVILGCICNTNLPLQVHFCRFVIREE